VLGFIELGCKSRIADAQPAPEKACPRRFERQKIEADHQEKNALQERQEQPQHTEDDE
jgi:hypothetical protein